MTSLFALVFARQDKLRWNDLVWFSSSWCFCHVFTCNRLVSVSVCEGKESWPKMLVGIHEGIKLSWVRPCVQIQAKLQWDLYSCPILPPAFVEKFCSFRGILLTDTKLKESPWWRSGLRITCSFCFYTAETGSLRCRAAWNKYVFATYWRRNNRVSLRQTEVRQKNLSTTFLSSRPQWLEVTFLVLTVKLGHFRSLTLLSLWLISTLFESLLPPHNCHLRPQRLLFSQSYIMSL